MSVINCYYIMDTPSLSELVSVSDTGGLNIKYFQVSWVISQYKFISYAQYFAYTVLSVNN